MASRTIIAKGESMLLQALIAEHDAARYSLDRNYLAEKIIARLRLLLIPNAKPVQALS